MIPPLLKSSLWTLLAGLLLCSVSGCSLFFGSPQEVTIYKLLSPPCSETMSPLQIPGVLLVRALRGEGLSDSKSVVFSRSDITLSTYRLATWSDSPTRQISRAIFDVLSCSDKSNRIVSGTEPVSYDYILSGTITAMYHDVRDLNPGTARLSVELDLYQAFPKQLIDRKLFSYNLPAISYDATGVVESYNRALIPLTTEVRAWVESSLNKKR